MKRKRILVLCASVIALVAAAILAVQLFNTFLPGTRDLGPGVRVSPVSPAASPSYPAASHPVSSSTGAPAGDTASPSVAPQVPVASSASNGSGE